MSLDNADFTLGTSSDVQPGQDAERHPALRAALTSPGRADIGDGIDLGQRPVSTPAAAVIGLNYADQSLGVIGGRDRLYKQVAGVYGESPAQGVFGHGLGPAATGVYGTASGGGIGVRAETGDGTALQAQCFGAGRAAWLRGRVDIEGDLAVSGQVLGDLNLSGDLKLIGADCAEQFDVTAQALALPGTVMVIGDDGRLQPAREAYDCRVAGVVSGAGDFRPGVVLHQRPDDAAACAPIALVGKVCCWVDAEHGAVSVGDLLTTSPTPGHAMRASDVGRRAGAVLGKALQPLAEGRGLVAILVVLQ